MNWTKREVKEALGIESDAELARFLRIRNRQAVNQWPDDEPIPEARRWQLRALRPDLFAPEPGEARAA